MPDYARQNASTASATSEAAAPTVARDAQNLLGNEAIKERLKSGQKPTYTGIVHFGLNPGAETEANLLDRLNKDQGGATSIHPQKEQDVVTRNHQRLDLTTEAGRAGFLATLGLPAELGPKVGAVLRDASGGARDELAGLIEVYAQAEVGVRRMDRLVLSGHNVGGTLFGDENGRLPFETFVALHDLFPGAAAQVHHLMVSACYSGGESSMEVFRDAFPNLQSILAYTGSSPGTASGAQTHLTKWEKATEKGDGSNVDKDLAKGTRKGENVATWNKTDGYQGDQPSQWWQVDAELSAGELVYQRYYTGTSTVADPQSGELRAFYNVLQRALAHPQLPAAAKPGIVEKRDHTIRLLYWGNVRAKFAAQNAAALKAGYAAAGARQPDFAKLSRAEALAAVRTFAGAAGTAPEAASLANLLQHGLVELQNDLVPETWL